MKAKKKRPPCRGVPSENQRAGIFARRGAAVKRFVVPLKAARRRRAALLLACEDVPNQGQGARA